MITLTLGEANYLLDVLGECLEYQGSEVDLDAAILNAQEIIQACLDNAEDVEIPDTQEQPRGQTSIF